MKSTRAFDAIFTIKIFETPVRAPIATQSANASSARPCRK